MSKNDYGCGTPAIGFDLENLSGRIDDLDDLSDRVDSLEADSGSVQEQLDQIKCDAEETIEDCTKVIDSVEKKVVSKLKLMEAELQLKLLHAEERLKRVETAFALSPGQEEALEAESHFNSICAQQSKEGPVKQAVHCNYLDQQISAILDSRSGFEYDEFCASDSGTAIYGGQVSPGRAANAIEMGFATVSTEKCPWESIDAKISKIRNIVSDPIRLKRYAALIDVDVTAAHRIMETAIAQLAGERGILLLEYYEKNPHLISFLDKTIEERGSRQGAAANASVPD